MPKYQAYRTGDPPRIWCGRCRKPFPLEIMRFQHRFALGYGIIQELDTEGDNIVWEGKWRYNPQDGLLSPHNDLLENLRHGRPARESGRRFLLPQMYGSLYQARGLRFPGCPQAAVCPHCLTQNRFNAVKLRVSPIEPSTTLTGS